MAAYVKLPWYGRSSLSWTFIFSCLGIAIPIVLPCLQFGVFYTWWQSYKVRVSRETCTCNCWDTVFKGPYEGPASGYKHVYFNVNSSTLVIWINTVVGIVVLYETVKYLMTLLNEGRLRYSMAMLVVASIYPHYYTWWSLFNAVNDDFFDQLFHQTVFSVTEVLSTTLVLQECNNDRPSSPRRLLAVLVIAAAHVLAAGRDQFVDNVLLGGGAGHQRARDVGFMAVDVLHLVVPYLTLRRLHSVVARWRDVTSVDELTLAIVCVVLLWMIIMVT